MNLYHNRALRKYLKVFFINPYIFIYLFSGIPTLISYPFIHSDEAWLSGLSRAWLTERSIAVTEPFFDLVPRAPHALKMIFHGIQAFFFSVFGYGILQTRVISLLFGLVTLMVFHRLLQRLLREKNSENIATFFTTMLAIDPQFVATAHLGRQEIVLAFLLVSAILVMVGDRATVGARTASAGDNVLRSGFVRGAIAGAIVAIGIGVHPAAFMVAAAVAGVALVMKNRMALLGGFVLACAAGALAFILASLWLNPEFFHDYRAFGDSVEVGVPFYIKIVRFPDYYQKLWYRHAGTYFIPELRLLIPLYLLSLAGCTALFIKSKQRVLLMAPLAVAGFNVALVMVGKYGPPLFALQVPLFYLSMALLFAAAVPKTGTLRGRASVAAVLALVAGSAVVSFVGAASYGKEGYAHYASSISDALGEDIERLEVRGEKALVLGNLNAEYALPYGSLLDFRNLALLDESGLDFASYVVSRGITHVLYPQEMDVIYRERPVWNILYGNVASYYDDMQSFLAGSCTRLTSFSSPVYGMRIVPYSGDQDWLVTVYRVNGVLSP